MISGKEITRLVQDGLIKIDPFNQEQSGPNSYDLRLGGSLSEVVTNYTHEGVITYAEMIDTRIAGMLHQCEKTQAGAFVLRPNTLYLGHTIETIGSDTYAPILHGRSSAARHGLMVHLCAGFGDAGWFGQYVLELANITPYPMLIWPGDRICQVSFEKVEGDIEPYQSTYQGQAGIVGAKGLGD